MAAAEKSKQFCSCLPGVVSLKPVQNARNDLMMEEATAFAKKLKACEKQITQLHKHMEGLVTTAEETMRGPFPRVWEIDGSGAPKPTNQFQEETYELARGIKKPTLEPLKRYALDPIEAWQHDYNKAKGRMKEVAAAQLALDAARRFFYKEQARHIRDNAKRADRPAAVMPTEADDPQLTAARLRANALEAAVHAELVQLAQRTRRVHLYLTAALHLEGQALGQAADATVLALEEGARLKALPAPPRLALPALAPPPIVAQQSNLGAPAAVAAATPPATPTAAAPAPPQQQPTVVPVAAATAAAAAAGKRPAHPAPLQVPNVASPGLASASSQSSQGSLLAPPTPGQEARPAAAALDPTTPPPPAPAHAAPATPPTGPPSVQAANGVTPEPQSEYPSVPKTQFPAMAQGEYPRAPTHAIPQQASGVKEEPTQEMLAATALMLQAIHQNGAVANGKHAEYPQPLPAV